MLLIYIYIYIYIYPIFIFVTKFIISDNNHVLKEAVCVLLLFTLQMFVIL